MSYSPLYAVLEQEMMLFWETKLNNANIGRQVAKSGLPSAPEQGGAKTRKILKFWNNSFFRRQFGKSDP